jgi:PAS domain S-box-containing protein
MPTLVLSLALVLLLGLPVLVLFHVGRGRREQAREAGMYAAMFEGNRSVKLVVDPGTGAIVDANSAAVRFYGYERSRLLSMHVQDLNTLPAAELSRTMREAAMSPRECFNFQHRLASGEVREVEVYSGPMVLEGRTLLFSIVHDVTDRHRAESELQRTVATLRGVLDDAQVAILATTEEGVITHFNRGAERLLGWSAGQMLGCSPLAFHDQTELANRSEDGVPRFETLVNFEPSTRALEGVWTWIDRWGYRHPVQLAIRRQESQGGSSGYVWVAVDLTALRAEESERREVGQRLQKLAAQIPGAVFQFRIHPDGRQGFPYVSPGVEALLGFSARELMADWKRMVDVVVPEDLELLQSSVATGKCVFRVRRGDQTRWLLGLASPEKEADGSLVLHGFVTDITEQKRIEAQLEQAREQALAASRVKSDFLANMSHEIRTPLNGILGLTQLVLETPLEGGQRDSLETVLKSGNTLLTLVNDILDLTRVESGHLALEAMPVRVDDLVGDVAGVVGPAAAEKDLEVLVEVDSQVPETLLGDPTRLRQVLTNLLGNAVKFTPQGWVALRVSARAGGVRFTVEDTGIGIPPEKQGDLFQVFSQVDASVTRRFGGSGLGLAITRRLVEQMGGAVHLESTPGTGTRFLVDLPLQAPAGLQPSSGSGEHATRPVVLLASPVQALRSSLASSLRRLGAEVAEQEVVDPTGPLPDGVEVVLVDTRAPASLDALRARYPVVRVVHLSSLNQAGEAVPGVLRLNRPILPATLRAVLSSRGGPPSATIPVPAPDQPRLSVLVAEDNLINAKVVTTLLRRDGHWVVHAADGKAAVAAFTTTAFDVVLMDVQMPELDGLGATRAIRALEQERGGHVHIIALTASAMKGDVERCLEAGMDAFLAKPLNLAALRQLIAGTARSRAA